MSENTLGQPGFIEPVDTGMSIEESQRRFPGTEKQVWAVTQVGTGGLTAIFESWESGVAYVEAVLNPVNWMVIGFYVRTTAAQDEEQG